MKNKKKMTANKSSLHPAWEVWMRRGQKKTIGIGRIRKALLSQLDEEGRVICQYTGIVLNPRLLDSHDFYPSVDHLISNKNHAKIAITTRMFNDMKNNFTIRQILLVFGLLNDRVKKKKVPKRYFAARLKKGYA